MLTPAEEIAAATWARMSLAWQLSVSLGEETFTDILSLDFTRLAGKSPTKLFQSTKPQESHQGTDLEIRIHVGGQRAIVVALQAKKLYQNGRYKYLDRASKFSPLRQIDLLERYARKVRGIPFFLLYNFSNLPNLGPYWHCCQAQDEPQLGCTLVPSWQIRKIISARSKRTFSSLHSSLGALPWRCLFDCPGGSGASFSDRLRDSLARYREDVHLRELVPLHAYDWLEYIGSVESAWPDWLWERVQPNLELEDLIRLQTEETRFQDAGWIGKDALPKLVPRRLLLVRSSPEEEPR